MGEIISFMNIYIDATNSDFGYLAINLYPTVNDILRLTTNIFPDEITEVYAMKKAAK